MSSKIVNFVCIGAIHYDKILKLKSDYFLNRTNPIIQQRNLGGVAFNIATKIAFLDKRVDLVSLNCENSIKKELIKRKIKFFPINKKIKNRSYISIINNKGQMILGLADMDIYEKNIQFNLKLKKNIILDLNFSKEIISKIINKYFKKNTISICGTSSHKVYKIKKFINKINILILNKQECINLTNKKETNESLKFLIKKNKKIVILITNGKNKIFLYYNKNIYSCLPPKIKLKNENGAGDVMSSIFLYFFFNSYSIKDSLSKSIAAGSLHAKGIYINNRRDYLNKINHISKKITVNKKKFYE